MLGVFYFLFMIFYVTPFAGFWMNVLLWLSPVILTYLITNISFQLIYRKEKLRFFKLFNGRKLGDKEIRNLGI
jgi:cytochrome c-type biogenesis protein CcmH/NrfF